MSITHRVLNFKFQLPISKQLQINVLSPLLFRLLWYNRVIMSGHSKWSQIKHQKGTTDQKRGQLFTKLSRAIMITIKENGGIADPESNFKLRLAIEKARQANMPKVNIDRAIERGLGKSSETHVEEVLFEGFAPYNVAVLITAVTNNRLRTTGILKNLFFESGGVLAGRGAVSYLFKHNGMVKIKINPNLTADEYILVALEVEANDIEIGKEYVNLYTKVEMLHKMKKRLEEKNYQVLDAQIVYRPISKLKIEKENYTKISNFINKLDNEEDIQHVFTNLDLF